ncbi:MAG: hypothetical protein J6U96_02830 [Elusimicrobiaceae bacterium]|nr:hypothetical protein [Elusimicrobiaceae bacterium]
MKKLLLVLGCGLLALGAQGQSIAGDNMVILDGMHGLLGQESSYKTSERDGTKTATEKSFQVEQAVEKMIAEKSVFSEFKIGKYVFALQDEKEFEIRGGSVHTYLYRAENGPAVFSEGVTVDKNGNAKLISDRFVAGRVMGPLGWRHEDYEIKEVQINVYSKARLGYLQRYWYDDFGKDCVGLYMTIYGDESLEVFSTPMRAFLLRDGRTVVITARAFSQKYGAYKRECKLHAPGVLYKQFMKATDQLKKKLNR